MALVIEDGSGLPNATTLVTIEEVRAFAEARGAILPDDDDVVTVLITKSIDYMKSRRSEYGGDRLTDTQALPFPRTGQYIDGALVVDGDIPQEAKDFQCGIILVLNEGIEFFPNTAERIVKRKKTGPLETEYFDGSLVPTTTAIDALIAPLLDGSGSFALVTRRI